MITKAAGPDGGSGRARICLGLCFHGLRESRSRQDRGLAAAKGPGGRRWGDRASEGLLSASEPGVPNHRREEQPPPPSQRRRSGPEKLAVCPRSQVQWTQVHCDPRACTLSSLPTHGPCHRAPSRRVDCHLGSRPSAASPGESVGATPGPPLPPSSSALGTVWGEEATGSPGAPPRQQAWAWGRGPPCSVLTHDPCARAAISIHRLGRQAGRLTSDDALSGAAGLSPGLLGGRKAHVTWPGSRASRAQCGVSERPAGEEDQGPPPAPGRRMGAGAAAAPGAS